MSVKNPQSCDPRQSTKTGPTRQSIMFPQGEDLPLFTGLAPTAVVRPYIPQEVHIQPSLIDLRPILKGAEPKPDGKKPGPS